MHIIDTLQYQDTADIGNRYALVELDTTIDEDWRIILNGTDENGQFVVPKFIAIDNYQNDDLVQVTIDDLITSVAAFTKTIWQITPNTQEIIAHVSSGVVRIWVSEQKLPVGEGVNQFGASTVVSKVAKAATRSELAGLDTTYYQVAYLTEFPRYGLFMFQGGDQSANVAADPQQGIYVPIASDASGAQGSWVRQYSGRKDARWFGAKFDTSDDYVALQAWLDSGGMLFAPALETFSSNTLIVRRYVNIESAGLGFDARVAGYAAMPGTRIVFAAGKIGLDIQPQWTGLDWTATAPIQEGALGSVIDGLALFGGGGAVAAGIRARTLCHLRHVHCYQFSGDGFDIDASVAVSAISDSGNASLSTLEFCEANTNSGNGFHLRGDDANVCKLFNCNSVSNTLFGYLDEAEFPNSYDTCHCSSNQGGGYKATRVTAAHVFTTCYIEGSFNSQSDISAPCVVVGGTLAGAVRTNNTHSNGPIPTIIDDGYTSAQALHIHWEYYGAAGAVIQPNDHGLLAGSPGEGLIIQGTSAGGYDAAMKNRNGDTVWRVPGGSKNLDLTGNYQINGVQVVGPRQVKPPAPTLADVVNVLVTHGLWA